MSLSFLLEVGVVRFRSIEHEVVLQLSNKKGHQMDWMSPFDPLPVEGIALMQTVGILF